MRFEDLKPGKSFESPDIIAPGVDGSYIKVANPVTCNKTDIVFNAVNEETGHLFHFNDDSFVRELEKVLKI